MLRESAAKRSACCSIRISHASFVCDVKIGVLAKERQPSNGDFAVSYFLHLVQFDNVAEPAVFQQ